MDRYISRFFDDNTFTAFKDANGSAEVCPAAHIDLKPFWISLENTSKQSAYY